MDVSQMQKLPGMPSGFPFAMVLLGIVSLVLMGIFHSIEARFFTSFADALRLLGEHLIMWGAFLQGVHWICTAFARKSSGPTA